MKIGTVFCSIFVSSHGKVIEWILTITLVKVVKKSVDLVWIDLKTSFKSAGDLYLWLCREPLLSLVNKTNLKMMKTFLFLKIVILLLSSSSYAFHY